MSQQARWTDGSGLGKNAMGDGAVGAECGVVGAGDLRIAGHVADDHFGGGGWVVGPKWGLFVVIPNANSCMFVFPRIMAPASFNLLTT